jgi:hypothetical protein
MTNSLEMKRKFVGGKIQVMCIGMAGTGAGTRIGGHLKYGGAKVRARHRRYATVCMTNEYMTSQTCSTCFHPVVRAQKRVLVDGKWKTKSVSGSSVCYNGDCPSYQRGCNTKNRDVEAAVNIAMAGISRMTTGSTLPPFERSTSHYKTGRHGNREPLVTGAPLVLTS